MTYKIQNKKIFIFASEISALIGKNKYKSQSDCIDKIIDRIRGNDDRNELKIFKNINKQQSEEIIEKLFNDDDKKKEDYLLKLKNDNKNEKQKTIKDAIDDCIYNKINEKDLIINNQQVKNIKKTLLKDINDINVNNYISSEINKNTGTHNEDKIIKQIDLNTLKNEREQLNINQQKKHKITDHEILKDDYELVFYKAKLLKNINMEEFNKEINDIKNSNDLNFERKKEKLNEIKTVKLNWTYDDEIKLYNKNIKNIETKYNTKIDLTNENNNITDSNNILYKKFSYDLYLIILLSSK